MGKRKSDVIKDDKNDKKELMKERGKIICRKRNQKINPFLKAKKMHDLESKKISKEEIEFEKKYQKQRLHYKKKLTLNLNKKTRRGQPLLKYKIKNMLDKLQNVKNKKRMKKMII